MEGGGAGPSTYRVQARSRGGRWCWTLNLKGPGEIKRREVVLDPQLTGSRRDQEEGGGAGPSTYRVQARSSGGRWCWTINLQGPGEIKRREVVLDPQLKGSRRDQEEGGGAGPSTYRVQARSRGGRWCWTLNLQGPGEIKRREVVLDPQLKGSRRDQEEGGGTGPSVRLAQKRSRAGRWSRAVKDWPFLLQVVTQQRCNGHCRCDCPS